MRNNRRKQRRRSTSSASRPIRDESNSGWQSSKLKGRSNRAYSVFAEEKDITLDAFADNACSRALAGRVSKAAAMSISKEIKHIESASAILAETEDEEIMDNWYEGAFSDDDDDDAAIEEATIQEEGEEGDGEVNMRTEEHGGGGEGRVMTTRQKGTTVPETNTGNVYPSVIWYLVSAYIYPEDVAIFACLCRDTHAMTNTAGFWRRLYFRYYNAASVSKLPKELHPTTIQRTFGLRSLVIRSLQYIYPPFANRNMTRSTTTFTNGSEAIEKILGMVFMYHVSKCTGSNYIYYLKFHQREPSDSQSLKTIEALAHNPDIHFNYHRGQCILMVLCKQVQHLEPERIMGKELVYVSVSVSTGMTSNRLKMEFQEPLAGRGRHQNWNKPSYFDRKRERTTVILDPMMCTRVFYWWHPLFREERFQLGEGNIPMNGDLNMWNAT